jgi:hypothetical protein
VPRMHAFHILNISPASDCSVSTSRTNDCRVTNPVNQRSQMSCVQELLAHSFTTISLPDTARIGSTWHRSDVCCEVLSARANCQPSNGKP